MKRIDRCALAREILRPEDPRRSLTGRQFIEMAGYSMVSALQAATGVSDKLIDRAIDEDNIVVNFHLSRPTDAGRPVAFLRAGNREIALHFWSAKLVRPVRPILRRRPNHALAI
jgi:hypothetical protein